MKKRYGFFIVLCFLSLFSVYGVTIDGISYDHTPSQEEHKHNLDQRNKDSGGEDGENRGGGGEESEEERAARIEAQKQKATNDIKDAKNQDNALLDTLDSAIDGIGDADSVPDANGDLDSAKQTENAELGDIENSESDAQNENNNQSEMENSDSGGDPVRITEGIYEQIENDLLISSIQNKYIKRTYHSNNKIVSSLGTGWIFNFDERIILGVDARADEHLQVLEKYCNTISMILSKYYNDLYKAYDVTSLSDIPDTVKNKITALQSISSFYDLIDIGITVMKEKIKKYDIADRVSVSSLEDHFKKSKQKKEYKIDDLNYDLEEYKKALKNIEKYNAEINKSSYDIDQYRQRLNYTNSRKARNAKALFSGMDTFYSETGNGTITLIDENGYPCLMNEYSSGEWRPAVNSKYVKCESISNGYKLTENNGVIKYFDYYGFITKIENRNGSYIQINRDANEHITTIQTSEGESFQFTYSNGFITKITNLRDIFQTVEYGYTGNYLTSVKDTEKDTVTMSYNSDGRMVSLNKCDGSSVKFEYGEYTSDGKYLTTCTINEEGKAEHFEYDRTNRKTTYKDHDGNVTVYYYDTKHRTTKEIKPDGTIIEKFYDDGKNLTRVIEDGNLTTYSYDSKGNKTKAVYSDNSTEQYSYDSHNLITLFIDRDGVRYDYILPKVNLDFFIKANKVTQAC